MEMKPLWDKAWSQWITINRETVIAVDQTNFPSQDFLVNMLLVFPLLYKKLDTFEENQLKISLQIINSAIKIPITKDTSPFLVPMINESSMSSVQRLALTCLSCIVTTDNVFDVPPDKAEMDVSSNNCLLNKSEITNYQRVITLLPRSHLYKGVFNELLTHFTLLNGPSSNLKQKFVSYTSFALSSLTLALQLLRAVVSSCDSHMTKDTVAMLVDFMKVHGTCTCVACITLKYNASMFCTTFKYVVCLNVPRLCISTFIMYVVTNLTSYLLFSEIQCTSLYLYL